MQELIAALQIIGAGQGIFLGLMLFSRRENQRANNILSLFIILFSLPMLSRYFFLKGFATPSYYISFIVLPTLSLHGPLIYLYTCSMTTGINKFRQKYILHCIPTMVIFIIYFFINVRYGFNVNSKMDMKMLFTEHLKPIILPIIFFSLLSGLLYTFVSWRLLHLYTHSIKEFFSNIIKLRLLWLKILLGLLLLMFLTMNIVNWLDFFNIIRINDMAIIHLLPLILGISSIFLTAFFALRQPDIFRCTHEMAQEFGVSGEYLIQMNPGYPKAKYEKYGIDDDKKEEYLTVLLQCMNDKKPYLNEDITLKDLADELSIPSHHLSIVINDRLQQNFYTFINSYRIRNVMEKLADPKNKDINVLNLAFDSGFNSKSTFNSAFRNITCMTPTEYRKLKHLDQSQISA
jgi:AraC-like DNA-binding protein